MLWYKLHVQCNWFHISHQFTYSDLEGPMIPSPDILDIQTTVCYTLNLPNKVALGLPL